MKISLLTFLTSCLFSLKSFAQPNELIDTAHIKTARISVFDDNWSLVNKPKRTFFDPFIALFQEKEFSITLFSDVKVDITNITKNAHYRLYLKNLSNESFVLISDRWTYNNCDSSASILIDRKLFNRPFRYEVSVIPMAKLDGKTFTPLNNKVTYKSIFGKPRAYFGGIQIHS